MHGEINPSVQTSGMLIKEIGCFIFNGRYRWAQTSMKVFFVLFIYISLMA